MVQWSIVVCFVKFNGLVRTTQWISYHSFHSCFIFMVTLSSPLTNEFINLLNVIKCYA